MIGHRVRVWAWLAAGHAAAAALYWALINVPETNAMMLALSALLFIAIVCVAAVVNLTALASLASREGPWRHVRSSLPRVPWFLAALLVFWAFSGVAGRLDAWHAATRGELDAWLIARFDLTTSGWLHAAVGWAAWILRWGFGVSLAVALAATPLAVPRSWRGWPLRGLDWRALGLTAVSLWGLAWLPWQAADWRPASLPPTWVEVAFAAGKLAAIYAVATAGWLLVLGAAARRCQRLPG
ncbi:MAG: hypothetical protein KJ066_07410 [Acidobacteria bacterium]|nr:hypothetical protein [Acidobacteriota bacterium]